MLIVSRINHASDTPMTEVLIYRGHKYRRYPESKHMHLRRYFYATEPRRGFLHRHKWEDAHGPIPEKHEIHHKDEDTLNNELDNLECVSKSWHRAHHLRKRSKTPEHLAHLEQIREMTKEWHASEEGREWHREHGKKSWEGRTPTATRCVCCGAEIKTHFPTRSKFCDNTCGSRYRRRGSDAEYKGAS